ncbi:MAG: hybrid sensor histidine kinase/response regulator [Gammaproteobacteria bacterium]|nr:hybrid sensor histidine kinase/response regulator [Gammaproteobacteria bacterium]
MSPSSGGISDLSMFDLFRMEIEGQTALLSKDLLALEQNTTSATLLESVMRASHSIKGAARMVSVEPVVQIAHVMEDCFVSAQKNKLFLQSSDIDLLLKAVDTIISISLLSEENIARWVDENDSVIGDLVAALEQVLAGNNIPQEDITSDMPSILPDDIVADTKAPVAEVDRFLRISAERMSRILGMTSELLVESREVKSFSDSLFQIKRRQDELFTILESWRELSMQHNVSNDDEIQKTALMRLDECRRGLSDQLLLLDEYDRKNGYLCKKLYGEVAGSRMRPFEDGVVGFQRMVRDLARSLNKEVVLKIDGLQCAVDRDVLEKIKAPLNHLLRNSIDHGIEPVEERAAAGKEKVATIKLSATHAGGMLRISVTDDGAGVDLVALGKKLITKNLITQEILPDLSNDELLEFLFLPDFSTRDEVTEISGRGVGLDVVREMVKELGGSVVINNLPGKGAKFILKLPLTLSVISALLVEISSEPYAFPLSKVDRILKINTKDITEMEGRQFIVSEGENVGLISAAEVLGFEQVDSTGDTLTVLLLSDRMDTYGVVVDRYIDQKQLSVSALDERLGKVPNVSSVALMENGEPLFILDADDLVRSINYMVNGGGLTDVYRAAEKQLKSSRKRILVVDDSLTVREVEKDLLLSKGYFVDLAVDGMDGWNAVRRISYDLVITDVDMPRMDGIDLVKSIKHDLHLKKLPVMIVSYKDRSEDRRRGLDAGADYYLTKGSFHDDTLLDAVEDLIGVAEK